MNTYITKSLGNIKKCLLSFKAVPTDDIETIINDLEMIKMEVEQHISSMPRIKGYDNLRSSGKNAVKILEEILELFEEWQCAEADEQLDMICEIIELIDDIDY